MNNVASDDQIQDLFIVEIFISLYMFLKTSEDQTITFTQSADHEQYGEF